VLRRLAGNIAELHIQMEEAPAAGDPHRGFRFRLGGTCDGEGIPSQT
jgi:hypothetical protein